MVPCETPIHWPIRQKLNVISAGLNIAEDSVDKQYTEGAKDEGGLNISKGFANQHHDEEGVSDEANEATNGNSRR